MNPAFRSSLPLALRIHLVDSEKGTVIGPFLTDRGCVLVLPEAVQPAVFDRETAEAVGQRLFKQWLNEKLRSTAASFPLLELSQIARQFGLQADAVLVRVDHLVDVNLPAIAHLTDGHYVVLYQMGAELVIAGARPMAFTKSAARNSAAFGQGTFYWSAPPSLPTRWQTPERRRDRRMAAHGCRIADRQRTPLVSNAANAELC
jgi:hypothetical protein